MRVIAGSARRLPLKAPKGKDVRPTTDRIKETLFNMIKNRLPGCDFLDLFGGSGAIGIEALSRGASEAVIVERDNAAFACIEENLDFTKLAANARLLKADAISAISLMYSENKKFDIIFMDPPYDKLLEKHALELLSKKDILAEDGVVIIEAAAHTGFEYVSGLGFKVDREKSYGSNKHVFLVRVEDK